MTLSYSLCYVLVIVSSKYVFGSDLSSLTFVIDDTSSMGDDIDAVRRGATDIFNTVLSHKNESQIDNFILVTFNDRSYSSVCTDRGKLRSKTKDRDQFKSALDNIRIGGGAYDCEECSMAGIKLGLEESLPGSSLYVFTDATAKDYHRFEEVKRLAIDKQCQIVFVLTGLCGEPTTSPKYKVYQDAADATQGQLFHIYKHEVNKVLDYVKMTITGRRDTKISTKLPPGSHNLTFDADALTGEVLFSLTSDKSNYPTVDIKAPDGIDVWKKVVFDTDKAKVYAVNAEKPGQYLVKVYTTAEAKAVVSAKSGIDFKHGFASTEQDSLVETRSTPAPGAKSHLFIKLNEGDIALKTVQIRDVNDKVIMELPLEISKNATKFYTTPKFEPPNTMFKIAIIGYDPESKSNITRMVPTFVEYPKILPGDTITPKPPSVVIEGEAKINANYDEPLELACKVEGYPKPNIVWKNVDKGIVFSTETVPGKNYQYDHINILTIKKVHENATYSCEANNANGVDSKQVALEVIRKRYLKFTNTPKNITVEYKEESKIFCTVDAYPPAEITWYKNDKIIVPDINIDIQVSHNDSVVTIKKSTLADEGKYSCEAKNEDSKQSIDTYFTIVGLESPVIDKNVTNVNVSKGVSTKIECKILKGMPKPSMTWTFGTTSTKSSTMEKWKNQEQIIIHKADTVDTGIYQCYAENDASSDQHEVHLVVEYVPTITKIDEKEELTVKTGSKISINCNVDGVPLPRVTWLKNNVEIMNTTKIHIFDNHTISFVADPSDTGDYICNATNKLGTDKKSVNVYVTVPATISSPRQRNKTLEVGFPQSTLLCRASGVPKPEIQWIYQNFDASVPAREMLESKGKTRLQLKNIQIRHEGYYTCIASNTAGSSNITYSVNVIEKPQFDTSSESEITVVRGSSTKLECKLLKGRPKPTITWYFRLSAGDKDSPEKFNEIPDWRDKESVVLNKVDKIDSGTYQCQAENEVSREYRELNVLVEYPPIILKLGVSAKFLKAVVGSEVTIPCDVDGRPPPQVTWLKDGVELVNDGKPYTFGVHVLKFVAQISHKGNYTCYATNKHGLDSKSVRIVVTDPATILVPKTTSYALPVGSSVTLPCKTKGDPKPIIKWTYQKFSARRPSHKILRHAKDNSLVLSRIQVSQEGNYTCTALNTGGTVNVTYEVQVFAPAAIVNTYKEKRFVVVEGDPGLQINCNTTGNPKPTITWTKDGSNLTLGTTYVVEEGTLFILNVTKDASGSYTCEVQNPRAIDQDTYEVIVEKYPPVDRTPSTIFIEKGQTKEIKCPLPHKDTLLRWYKDEQLIYKGELLLINASVRHSGYYSCRVSTLTKSYSKGVEVFVGYKPVFIAPEEEQIDLADSLPVSLNCESDSRPEGHVTWYHDGEKLDLTGGIYYFETGISNPGQYRCEVTNTFGNISRTFNTNTKSCVIQLSTLAKNLAPLLLDSDLSWHAFQNPKENIVIANNTQIILYCPSGFAYVFDEFDNKYITAFCTGGNKFKTSKHYFDYSDIVCTEEVKSTAIRTGQMCMPGGENTETVNIGYKVIDDYETVVYEVCLNKMTEAPIYAKHTMQSSLADDEEDTPWSDNDQFQMNFDEAYDCDNQIGSITKSLDRFFHHVDGCCFFRRQLVNPKDVFPGLPQKSTYSYFNVVPHWSTCNTQNWNDLEQRVRKLTQSLDSDLLVWTGVAQELYLQTLHGGITNIVISDIISNGQQVPLFLWKVIQDPVSNSSLAIIQVNVPDLRPADVSAYILCNDLCDRIAWMNNDNWHDVEKGYTYCCELTQFENVFEFNGIFEPNMNSLLTYSLD